MYNNFGIIHLNLVLTDIMLMLQWDATVVNVQR